MSGTLQRKLTRRRLLGIAAAGGIAGVSTSVYGLERYASNAPFASASGFAAPRSSGEGGGAPLLVVRNPRAEPNFSAYLEELLGAEGLIAYRTASVLDLSTALLTQPSTILLASGPLTVVETALLRTFVSSGGALVALRPDALLDDVFGVRNLGSFAPADYLFPTPGSLLALPNIQRLQVFGAYQRLALAGAELLARSASGDPLITSHRYGEGTAVLWAFDLPHSIALARQGNPLWANQDRDSIPGVRAADMFVGWVDPELLSIPQADEHQRLLSGVLQEVSSPPLPRLWYFPPDSAAVIVATGDAHGSDVTHIEQVLGTVERNNGTMSVYYTPPTTGALRRIVRKTRWVAEATPLIGSLLRDRQGQPTPAHVVGWRSRGHEFGMHPYVEAGLEAGYNAHWNEFLKFGYGPLPPTVRTHRILWHGWVENARVQARYGLRMNLDHYHIGSAVQHGNTMWAHGYLSGTGLPLRFVAEDGALLSVYQQPTHLVDEHLMNVFDTGFDMGLTGERAATATIDLISDAIRHFPAALGLQCHIDPFLFGGEKATNVGRWLEMTLSFAAAHKVAILSAERWLAFVESRNRATIHRLSWDPTLGVLTFTLNAEQASDAAELLLPATHRGRRLRAAQIDAETAGPVRRQIQGREYQALPVTPGTRTIIAAYDAV